MSKFFKTPIYTLTFDNEFSEIIGERTSGQKDCFITIHKRLDYLQSGIIKGFSSVLVAVFHGEPASKFQWKLYRDKKLIQKGQTNESGVCDQLKLPFPHKQELYTIELYKPKQHKIVKSGDSQTLKKSLQKPTAQKPPRRVKLQRNAKESCS